MKDKEWAQKEIDRYLSYEGVNEARNALVFAKGVINQLDEPEVLSKEWVDEHRKSYTMEDSVDVSDLQNLLVPKQEEITEEQAWEVIEDKYDFSILQNVIGYARAWLDGYTVEKEQKYYARIKGWELFADFVGVKYWGIVSIYGRLGFVSADDAKDNTKDEWKRLGIDESNADFVKVGEELN